jgi:hypothetical protein
VKVLAGGGSGLAGSRLCPALAETGHDVVTMTRHPGSYDGAGTPIRGDVHDPATLKALLIKRVWIWGSGGSHGFLSGLAAECNRAGPAAGRRCANARGIRCTSPPRSGCGP